MPASCALAAVISPLVKVSGIRYLVDAGPLIGLFDADDQWHKWSAETLQAINAPMATTEAVLAEVAHRLRRLRPAVVILPRLVAERRLIVYPALADHAERIEALLGKYEQMDLADASLVVLSEVMPRAKLVTLDVTDFQVYRRRDGKAVPAIMPI